MNRKANLNGCLEFVDLLALFLIGAFCFLCSIFTSDFAELGLHLQFLDFPIFAGEILLMTCMGLFLFKLKYLNIEKNILFYLFFSYVVWVVGKALYGYYTLGPLSFRNAALFYYPLFVIFGYYFYGKTFTKQTTIISLSAFLLLTAFSGYIEDYYRLVYFLLLLVLSLHLRMRWIKYAVWIFVAVLCVLQYEPFFRSSRSHLIGSMVAALFLVWYILSVSLKSTRVLKISLMFIFLVALIIGMTKFAEKTAIQTLSTPRKVVELFQQKQSLISRRERNFTSPELLTRLYNKNAAFHLPQRTKKQVSGLSGADLDASLTMIERIADEAVVEAILSFQTYADETLEDAAIAMEREKRVIIQDAKLNLAKNLAEYLPLEDKAGLLESKIKEALDQRSLLVLEDIRTSLKKEKSMLQEGMSDSLKKEINEIIRGLSSKIKKEKSLEVEYNNILFRLFIWRDMLEELVREKSWWGVNFGKPQRSKSIEILGWAAVEWRRDGWITPHNSYLHILYRGGLIGVAFIGMIFFGIFYMTKKFLRMKSVTGGLLLSILLYWMALSNFLVFLELPYNAIPFWSLFGLTLAYARNFNVSTELTGPNS